MTLSHIEVWSTLRSSSLPPRRSGFPLEALLPLSGDFTFTIVGIISACQARWKDKSQRELDSFSPHFYQDSDNILKNSTRKRLWLISLTSKVLWPLSVKDIRVGNKVKKGAEWTFTPETQQRGLYLTLTLNSTSFSLGNVCGNPKQPEVEGTQFKWVPVSWVLVYILTSSSLPSLYVQLIKTTDFSQKI